MSSSCKCRYRGAHAAETKNLDRALPVFSAVSRCLIALVLSLHAWVQAAEEAPVPGFEYRGDLDWEREAQRDFFRENFGQQAETANPDWPQDQYDPRPAEGETPTHELTLPMPCGGSMVFRRIEVGGNSGWLGEQQIQLGSVNDRDAPIDGRRLEYISGTFTGDGPEPAGGRFYFLGKYEVTELQYGVLDESCPPQLKGRRPAVKVSWYDAVDFTRRYSEWLNRNAPERLPNEDGVRGFLRLPTEAEWEFAARGGLAVDDAEFHQPVFPTGQLSIDDYAWFRESVASSFEPRPVGALLPNPLGLYDILGNASELVFDLFRLSTRGRLHARPGGFLVKGGHFRTARNAVRSSWRQEHPHFSPVKGMPNRLDTVGFRVVISAPVLTSEQRMTAIRKEWSRLPPAPLDLAGADPCHDLAVEVRSALSAMQASLEGCLPDPERLSPPSPPLPLAELPAVLRTWSQVRDNLRSMGADEIRRQGLGFLRANHTLAALVLFKQAAERGDGWSALAIGAMHDPLLSEADAPAPRLKRIGEPSAGAALCWYRLARHLGEQGAAVRVEALEARGMGAELGGVSGPTPAYADCEQIMPDSGIP